jgi:hypothetical protein
MNERQTIYHFKSEMHLDGKCDYYSVAITDDVLPGFQKKYIRSKNPVPLVVVLEIREIDSKEYICVIERKFVHYSMNREDWFTHIVKQWNNSEANMILANEFFDKYRKGE